MTYCEFVNAVEERMKKVVTGGVKTSIYKVLKNNGKERTGILVEIPGINISPTIYLEEFYENYKNGESFDSIIERVISFYESVRQREPWECERFQTYEGVKEKVVFKLINTAKNRRFLSTVPHLAFLDLSIVFYVLVEISIEGTASMMVNYEHAKLWDVTAEELWEDAIQNAKQLLPAELLTMSGTIQSMMGDQKETVNLLTGEITEHDHMYVLSNKLKSYGAACIAYPHLLNLIGSILKNNYYILPSSVHEVIIVPYSEGLICEELNDMVREINATQVEEEEVLSNHIYLFDRVTGKIRAGETVLAGGTIS